MFICTLTKPRDQEASEGLKTGGSSRHKQERNDKLRGGGVKRNEGERVFITDGRTVGWMRQKEGKKEQERERPDLFQCDPVIWGVGVATQAVWHRDAGVWVTEPAGAWAWGTWTQRGSTHWINKCPLLREQQHIWSSDGNRPYFINKLYSLEGMISPSDSLLSKRNKS